MFYSLLLICLTAFQDTAAGGSGLQRPDVEFKIFQFPADQIPRIDGDASDWKIVPESYAIGTDQLKETTMNYKEPVAPSDLSVKVKVGWVKGMHHLYFLYEAEDDYWDFEKPDLHNDIFELVVDADLSGGPFIRQFHPIEKFKEKLETHFLYHGVHAQNYHVFTPAQGKDWTMIWGSQPWIKDLPHANAASKFNFKPGQSGKLTLEFYVTPFDYAPPEPSRAMVSKLEEGRNIGMSWAILDYDGVDKPGNDGFWSLSHKTTMYGNASDLVSFRLMPIEDNLRKPVEANWRFQVVSQADRQVAFHDQSHGKITSWKWDFGDGETSTEKNPIHTYNKAGEFVVILYVEGPEGKDRRSKVWDVTLP
jgi:PKD domain